jgi:hypothetical protein
MEYLTTWWYPAILVGGTLLICSLLVVIVATWNGPELPPVRRPDDVDTIPRGLALGGLFEPRSAAPQGTKPTQEEPWPPRHRRSPRRG